MHEYVVVSRNSKSDHLWRYQWILTPDFDFAYAQLTALGTLSMRSATSSLLTLREKKKSERKGKEKKKRAEKEQKRKALH